MIITTFTMEGKKYIGLLMLVYWCAPVSAATTVWPPPKSIVAAGTPTLVAPDFHVALMQIRQTSSNQANKKTNIPERLQRAIRRFTSLVQQRVRAPAADEGAAVPVRRLAIFIDGCGDQLEPSLNTL